MVIAFDCYRIAGALPLAALRTFLGLKETPRRREAIRLEGQNLERLLKYAREGQAVYLFPYGCAAFVNCSADEIRTVLRFLTTGFDIDEAAEYYREAFTLEVHEADGEASYSLFGDIPLAFDAFTVQTLVSALAKLTALAVMEEEVGRTFDDAESFIARMGRGRMSLKARKYAREVARIVRFQYDSACIVRVFERCDIADAHLGARALYDEFMAHFEYGDRLHALREKIRALEDIFRVFLTLNSKWQENRELYVEIALLVLFPLFYLF
jgi:uncharacterized Rmd1/YagE family protein